MKTVRVGYGRLYNAGHCSLLGREEVNMRFDLEGVNVLAHVGPKTRHIVLTMKVGHDEPMDEKLRSGYVTRERGYDLPSPEIYPANLYAELVATQAIEVEDTLAAAFYGRDKDARGEMLRKAWARQSRFTSALDYTAGVLGLRLHPLLVSTPILEQCYAYRRNGEPYALSIRLQFKRLGAYKFDATDEGVSALKKWLPQLQPKWTWERAAEVLAWLLRAWAAKDSVLRFVSLFIPLECVMTVGKKELSESEWWKKRQAIFALVENHAEEKERKDLRGFIKGSLISAPLAERFANCAMKAALPGWKNDVEAFRRFYKMRNSLVHRGQSDVEFRITVEPEDVRTLEDIAERYVSLALFGDANVYESKKRPSPGGSITDS
jgi:hypothetical protein